jgi:threonine dehydratase
VDHCTIGLRATTPDETLDEIRQVGAEVLPQLR